MTKKIFRTIFVVAIVIFLISAILFMTRLYSYFSNINQKMLRSELEFVSKGLEDEGLKYLENLNVDGYRITWINSDGSVIYDNLKNAQEMENHLYREEVKNAINLGYGESKRYSSTFLERYQYEAKRLSDGTIIRLSQTQKSLLVLTLGMIQPTIFIFIIAALLSLLLASKLSKKIVEPLNNLNLDKPLENDAYDELSPLLRRIDSEQQEIRKQSDELKYRQNEFETMTESMVEGIVLLNNQRKILSINKAAEKILNTDNNAINLDILSFNRSLKVVNLLNDAEDGKHTEVQIEIGDNIYLMIATPILTSDVVTGIVLLILDVTEKEKREELRREFTANVSHELKSPLQVISGSAELLSSGIVDSDDVPSFSKRIFEETKRMILLIDDIIELSHLDETNNDIEMQNVDLYAVSEEIIERIKDKAKKDNITLSLTGENVTIMGVKELVNEIIYNLIDNAIKYNKKDGRVDITISDNISKAKISIKDTGIGIAPEHQNRIFERFYRVDKSHSKEIGGTGLGLSIVKHALLIHNAKIVVNSSLGEGTEMIVTFPKTC